jgi:hypothetical protein
LAGLNVELFRVRLADFEQSAQKVALMFKNILAKRADLNFWGTGKILKRTYYSD